MVEFDLFFCHRLCARYFISSVWYQISTCYFGTATRRAITRDCLYFCLRPLVLCHLTKRCSELSASLSFYVRRHRASMRNRHLKLATALCMLFCIGRVIQQAWFLLFVPAPDPTSASFAVSYRVTSTIETGVIVVISIGASVLLYTRQTPFRGLAVGALCLFIIWRSFFANLGMFFSPMFGDGSLSAAATGWWHLHSPLICLHSISFLVLLIASICAFYGSYVISKRNNRVA